MSLATRCSSCGTIFKVVQDQLKVSEGWVRCGRCQVVFNALDGLFDLERDAPPARPTPTEAAAPDIAAPIAASPDTAVAAAWISTEPLPLENTPSTKEEDALESRWLVSPTRSAAPTKHQDFTDAQFPQDLQEAEDFEDSFFDLADPPLAAEATSTAEPAALLESQLRASSRPSKPASSPSDAAATPGFVKRAERKALWQHPAMRALSAIVVLLLIGLLGSQVALQERNEWALRYPWAAPYYQQACALLGCRLAAVQHIEDLSVDSATLSQPVANQNTQYRLVVALRNHADIPLATPHLDLTLSDAQGQVIVRRAIAPDQIDQGQWAKQSLPAQSTQNLDLHFSNPTASIAGYTVEIFYP